MWMSSRFIIFMSVLAFSGTAFGDYFVSPHIAMSHNYVCLWAKNNVRLDSNVGCWDKTGAPVNFLPRYFRHPQQVTVADNFICAVQDGVDGCYGANFNYFNDTSPIAEVATNGPQSCVISAPSPKGKGGSIGCSGDQNLIPFQVPVGHIFHDVVMGPTHACVLSDDNRVMCWGGQRADNISPDNVDARMNLWNQNLLLVSPPSWMKFDNPMEVAIGSNSTTCVLDGPYVRCWPGADPSQKLQWSGLGNSHSLSVGADHVCVITEGNVPNCWKLFPADGLTPAAGFDHSQALITYDQSFCSVNGTHLGCWAGGWNLNLDYRSFLFRLFALDYDLDQIRRMVYEPKGRFFQRLTSIIRSGHFDGPVGEVQPSFEPRLFIFYAIEPLIENIESPYVQRELLGRYRAAREYYKEHYSMLGLDDFTLSAPNIKLSFELIEAALDSMEEIVISKGDKADIAELKVLLGQGMVSDKPASMIPTILKEMDAKKSVLAMLKRNYDNVGLGMVLDRLRSYLSGE